MTELKKFEYFFLRYTPYPMMDDYVSFGIIMQEHALNGFAGVRFMKSFRRLVCLHPDADLDYFRFLKHDITEHLQSGASLNELLTKMHDCFGNAVQISPNHECLAEDGEAAIKLLAKGSLDLPTGRVTSRARKNILNQIQTAYETAGIWSMVFKNEPVSDYTYKGDPLKIDVSYRPNGVIKMLQAVSIDKNVEYVKSLAFSYPQLVAGIAKKENAGVAMTAIVDENLDRNESHVDFALSTLEKVGVEIAVTAELPIVAEKARRELNIN